MWNLNNQELLDRCRRGYNPTDAEYGEYLMRELMTAGYQPRHVSAGGFDQFLIRLDLLGGRSTAVLLCKSVCGDLSAKQAKALLSLRPVCRADVYAFVCSGDVPADVAHIIQMNDTLCLAERSVGCEVFSILQDIGALPPQVVRKVTQYQRLEQQVREMQSRQQEMEMAAQAAAQQAAAKVQAAREQFQPVSPAVRLALPVVAQMETISTNGLAHRMHIGAEDAKRILSELSQLGVIGPLQTGQPRRVIMTPAMIERRFGVHVRNSLRG